MSRTIEQAARAARPSRSIVVHFACNGDGGHFQGFAEGISVHTGRGSFELDGDARFTVDERGLRLCIERVWFPFVSSREWVGNWCWNAYRLKRPQALLLIATLRRAGWTCSGGDARLCDWFDRLPLAGPEALRRPSVRELAHAS